MGKCYVREVSQVSCQGALVDDWFDSPRVIDQDYVRADEPDVKSLVSPSESRRMSRMLKRTVATSFDVLKKADGIQPDAIIMSTGNGCIENSEKFLSDICLNGESCLKPTLFMQSTHNTMSSLVAILMKNHGYNNTYSHKEISFESALLDAWVQLKSGALHTALVGAHDEVTPLLFKVISNTRPHYGFVSEASVGILLSDREEKAICEVRDVKLFHKPKADKLVNYLKEERDSILMLGVNGNDLNDLKYKEIISSLDYKPEIWQYKNVFGDCFSASALGFYAAVTILRNNRVPDFMRLTTFTGKVSTVTLINYSPDDDWGIVRLEAINKK